MSIYFQDESSIEINKKVGRIIIRRGRTKINKFENIHNGRHIFGVLSTDGDMIYRTYKNKKKDSFLSFLKYVRGRTQAEYILMVLDNASIHKAKVVREYAEQKKIYFVYLPSHSPDMNFIEFYWKPTKRNFQKIQWLNNMSLEAKIRIAIKRVGRQEGQIKARCNNIKTLNL